MRKTNIWKLAAMSKRINGILCEKNHADEYLPVPQPSQSEKQLAKLLDAEIVEDAKEYNLQRVTHEASKKLLKP